MLTEGDTGWLTAAKDVPLVQLTSPLIQEKGVELWVARLDLVDPLISGNKWFKLKYNLLQACDQGYSHIVSFGGAYSNHLHALAAACHRLGIHSTGIVRGEIIEPLNPTLQDCADFGMTLSPVTRGEYRQKHTQPFIDQLHQQLGDFYLVPEGGSNVSALRGMSEVSSAIVSQLGSFDYLCCPVGSGGTLAGLSLGLSLEGKSGVRCIGFSALKGADTIESEINNLHHQYLETSDNAPSSEVVFDSLCQRSESRCVDNWNVIHDYHFGGFARINPILSEFMQQFEVRFEIPLEQVYTAKMFYGLLDQISRDRFESGSRVVAVHTGGLQGRRGYESISGQ